MNHYERLQVARDATAQDVKRAYRRQAARLHPDVNRAPDATYEFQALQEAYRTLSDPTHRYLYDQRLDHVAVPRAASPPPPTWVRVEREDPNEWHYRAVARWSLWFNGAVLLFFAVLMLDWVLPRREIDGLVDAQATLYAYYQEKGFRDAHLLMLESGEALRVDMSKMWDFGRHPTVIVERTQMLGVFMGVRPGYADGAFVPVLYNIYGFQLIFPILMALVSGLALKVRVDELEFGAQLTFSSLLLVVIVTFLMLY
ncbi:MAG: DnaJ domain-containing protein [Catalinimonas sp.]